MKREHFQLNPQPGPSSMTGKSKLWEDGSQRDGGVDELLAVLGYEVRSSDMVDVAQKLEKLEEFMGNVQEDGLSYLASETVHYNPSDLSTWLESMIYELNPSPTFDSVVGPPGKTPLDGSFLPPADSCTVTSIDFAEQRNQWLFEGSSNSDYDLKAIPGKAICNRNTQFQETWSREKKRLKPSSELESESESEQFSESLTGPVVLVDSQENGIQLVHTLMACAEAVHQNSLNLAEALLKRVGYLAVSQTGAMRKVATYFAEALARRIYRLYPRNALGHSFSDSLQSHFYESCPYLKFAHFTANQAILEAFEGKKRVHVVDFSMNQGMQWPALLQVLALRPGGPPAFRLTGIGPPARDNSDYLREVGWKLAQLAEMIHVKFEYRGFVANTMADLDLSMLELRPSEDESVAVNSVFEFHKLFARPGAIGKVLSVVKQMKPSIVTVVEQEASHNGPSFLNRFTESLHYYSTLFDSLEGSLTANNQDKAMTEMYLGKQICNVVACEGADRVERHENLTQWRTRFHSAGFDSAPLGSNAYKQASILLALFGSGDGYGVEERNGCLMLGWHSRPLITTSAWRVAERGKLTQ